MKPLLLLVVHAVAGSSPVAHLHAWLLDEDALGSAHTVPLTSRLATRDDIPSLLPLMEAAIDELQKGFLDEAQIRSSHAIMGLDHQLIDDGTYFVIECDGQLAGCGGWSRRATLYGGATTARAGTARWLTRHGILRGSVPCTPTPPLSGVGSVA